MWAGLLGLIAASLSSFTLWLHFGHLPELPDSERGPWASSQAQLDSWIFLVSYPPARIQG